MESYLKIILYFSAASEHARQQRHGAGVDGVRSVQLLPVAARAFPLDRRRFARPALPRVLATVADLAARWVPTLHEVVTAVGVVLLLLLFCCRPQLAAVRSAQTDHEGLVRRAVSHGPRASELTAALPAHAHGSARVGPPRITHTRQPGKVFQCFPGYLTRITAQSNVFVFPVIRVAEV